MESGIRALPVALALRLPGDYPPLWGLRGINQHGELAVVEQAQRAVQPTADRDLIFISARIANNSLPFIAAYSKIFPIFVTLSSDNTYIQEAFSLFLKRIWTIRVS